ncbi:MAG: helix-turn-helix domain-containing protein [Gemmatimonadota bacterium]
MKELGLRRAMIAFWRTRFAARRLEGVERRSGAGAPRQISDADVERAIATTLEQAPTNATHWSTRRLAKTGTSQTTVTRIWVSGCYVLTCS